MNIPAEPGGPTRHASIPRTLTAAVLGMLFASPTAAVEVYRCTAPDGGVSYQQWPCPPRAAERRVDVSPANPAYDPLRRDEVLRQGAEVDKRLEERAAREAEESRRRRLEEQLAREAARRSEPVQQPVIVEHAWPFRPMHPVPRPPRPRPHGLSTGGDSQVGGRRPATQGR